MLKISKNLHKVCMERLSPPRPLKVDPMGWKMKVLQYARLFLASIGRVLFTLYYGKKGEKLPAITNDILKQPAVETARRIRSQELTSVEVLEACMKRIKDVNSALNCFVEDRFELALKEAKGADELIRGGTMSVAQLEREKPLLGVPFTTKDSIAVKGLHHTSGVVLRKDIVATEDAAAIKLLRDKGAIIVGLTNVPEICMWWESHNHIHGRTKNPYNTTRIPGGSSGGEGSLQAAAGTMFGVGSDIGGSIRLPAFFNGIFGHKPSGNIVPNEGQYPYPANEVMMSCNGIGPMTRHAADLKPLLKIMSGVNAGKLDLDRKVDIKKLRVFYQLSNNAPFTDSVHPEITAALKKLVEFLNIEHDIKAEEKLIPLLQEAIPIWYISMKSKDSFASSIMEKEGTKAIIVEMFKNLLGCSGNTFIGLVSALLDNYTPEIGSEKYNHYLGLRDDIGKIFAEMLGDDGVFLYPTLPTTALYHNESLLRPFNISYTCIINCLGLPATAVPLGLSSEGLPIGIQVVANRNNDRLCLAVAEELDRAFGGWVEPR